MSSDDLNSEIVMELAEEFLDRYRRGERPPLAEYTSQHPNLAEEIREVFPAMAMMENIAIDDESLAAEKDRNVRVSELEKLGDFRIIREVGRGGMGVVYEAEQVSLGRHVALKVLPASALPDSKHVRRFEREAKSAAKLHHTNIVPVFGVGEQDGMHYYVMQFIQGLPLDEVIDELKKIQAQPSETITATNPMEKTGPFHRQQSVVEVAHSLMSGQFAETQIGESDSEVNPSELLRTDSAKDDSSASRISETMNLSGSLSGSTMTLGKSGVHSDTQKRLTYWQSVANIGVQVADALQYAHEQAILHRDIKPSNLLLDLRGTTWVTDFGLAKATDQQDITHTGDILGTLRYMPTEAFDGIADARSDVYSLGLTLYELLAFQPAFGVKERHQLIKQVTTESAPRLDKLNPQIPRDLVTIVHKAIDRDRAHRYQTAQEMQEDLHRFLEDEPIKARRISLTERLIRWSRRNKGLAISLAAVCALLLIINIAGPLMYLQLKTSLEAEKKSAYDAQSAKAQAEYALVSMSVERAVLAAEREHNSEAMLWFARAVELAPEDSSSRRDNLVRAAQYREGVMRPVRMFEHPANWVERLEFDPSGRYLLSYSVARGETQHVVCRLWDIERGEPLKLPEFSGILTAAAFRSDGRLVALGTSAGGVLLWDLDDNRIDDILNVEDFVQDLAFSDDGLRLGLAAGKLARVWDVHSDAETMISQPHPNRVLLIALSGNGDRFATTCGDNQLRVFEYSSDRGQTLLPPVNCRNESRSLSWEAAPVPRPQFVDKGQGLLYVGLDELRYLDLERSECLASGRRRISDYNLKFTKPCAIVTHGWYGNELQTFAEDAEPKLTEISHRRLQPIYSAAFLNDGSELLTAGGDRFVKSWSVADGSPGKLALEHSSAVSAVRVSPEGHRFATAQQGGLIIVWEPFKSPPLVESVESPIQSGTLICVSRDGKLFAPTGRTNRNAAGSTTQVYDSGTHNPIGKPVAVAGILLDACFSHDGERLLTISSDRRTSTERGTGTLQVWDWRSGELAVEVSLNAEPRALDVSPDGDRLAVLCTDGTIRTFAALTLLEPKQWQAVEPFTHSNWYIYNGAMRFAPQGRRLAIWNTDRHVHVYDADNGTLAYSVEHSGLTRDIAFSADGRFLATSSGVGGGNDLRVIDAETGRLLAGPISHPDWVFGLAFSPDGTLLASACRDSSARIWDWRKETLYLPPLEHDHEVHDISFSPDGRFVITSGDDQYVRLWSAADGKPIVPPQPLSGSGWSIQWCGHSAVIAGSGTEIAVLDLDQLDEWTELSVVNVVQLCELTAGRRIEAGGEAQLTATDWIDRYRSARAALPAEFNLGFEDASDVTTVQTSQSEAPLRELLAQHWRRVSTTDTVAFQQRVFQYVRGGNWDKAARETMSTGLNSYFFDTKLAAILADNGLLDEYRQLCELDLKMYESTSGPYAAQLIAEMCLLMPAAVSDLQAVRRLIVRAQTPPQDYPPELQERLTRRSQMIRGLMALREGEFEAAIEWSRRAREGLDEVESGWSVWGYVPSLIVEALAQRRSGHEDEAEKLLSSPYAESAVQWPVKADEDTRTNLHLDLFLSRILLREAERLPAELDDAETLIQRARIHTLLGHFSTAAEAYQRSLELNPDNQLITCYRSSLLLALEDNDGFASARRTLIERWGSMDENVDAIMAERTAKAYLLSPEPGPDLERACALADLSVERGTGQFWEPAFWLVKALAEYRRGNNEEALVWSGRIEQREDLPDEWLPIAAGFVSAMAHHRLEQTSQAQLELESTRKDFSTRINRGTSLPSAIWDPDDVVCLVLQREATALIEKASPDGKPSNTPAGDESRNR